MSFWIKLRYVALAQVFLTVFEGHSPCGYLFQVILFNFVHLCYCQEVYGGDGKVKVKRKNKNNQYSCKYGGPEKGAQLLENAIHNVKELQTKSELWKFTQRLEVTSMSDLNQVD